MALEKDDTNLARNTTPDMEAAECHGCCFGFEAERDAWEPPQVAVRCKTQARPGYESLDASEYLDTELTLKAKVRALADLVRKAQRCVVYSGAGLSTSAGIGDYASQAPGSLTNVAPPPRADFMAEIRGRAGMTSGGAAPLAFQKPFVVQPTTAHRALAAMHAAGHLLKVINQNHDGLPQKAGLPQEAINEIHGAWFTPSNPVVKMSGTVRDDLFADLVECERKADLAIAVGTSLCGMNADRVVVSPMERAGRGQEGQLGGVIIGLQRTVHDKSATLRIFGRCDDVLAALAEELDVSATPAWFEAGEFFMPACLAGRTHSDYVFHGIPYNSYGEQSPDRSSTLDLREDVEVVIPDGTHAGAVGTVEDTDKEGNVQCMFKLKPTAGKLRLPTRLILGRWWIQAAVDGTVPVLPVVNRPAEDDNSHAAECLRIALKAYTDPEPR